jgi:hypothetical protein
MSAFERVKESRAKVFSLTSCGAEMDPRFRGGDEFLSKIKLFRHSRESGNPYDLKAHLVHFDFFTYSVADKG